MGVFFAWFLLTLASSLEYPPLPVNTASEDEILSYPLLSTFEAELILRERNIRLFKDSTDFFKRVPLSPFTKKLISPLLDFSVKKKVQ